MLNFGFHVSSAGGIEKIPQRVNDLGGECFQFFARSPHGGKTKEPSQEQLKTFFLNLKKFNLNNYYIHTPYFINLASKDNRIFYGSINTIKEDLERANVLKAKYVVTHLGSAKDFVNQNPLFSASGEKNISSKYLDELVRLGNERNFDISAFERVIFGLNEISKDKSSVPLLIEISAGSGAVLGLTLKEIAYYLENVPALSGFCLDTAHAFASGYDFRAIDKITDIFQEIESVIGKEKLKLIHLNDSLAEYGSKVDRHAHLGEGKIGKEAFKKLVDYFYKENYNVDIILETPTLEGMARDLSLLKKWRNEI